MSNREEILANFQACTGVEDLALAICHLDECNWDLMSAVSRVISPESQTFQTNNRNDSDVMIVDDDVPAAVPNETASSSSRMENNFERPAVRIPGYSRNHLSQPSTSRGVSSRRMISFKVSFAGKFASIELPDNSTIKDLKKALQKEFKVPVCRQILLGWVKKNQDENTPFYKLMINRENALDLVVMGGDQENNSERENELAEKLTGMFTLNVKYEDQIFNLNFGGSSTVLEVKNGLYALTNIEVRNQRWIGWPNSVKDEMPLALSGINYPEHDLILSRNNQRDNETNHNNAVIRIDSDDEEYVDAAESINGDDDYFVEDLSSRRHEPLIPENVGDELTGCTTFIERFSARYGPVHPTFFPGPLSAALQEACNKPAKDRKILAIYLHHDKSVLTNVFCSQLLGFESVMEMLDHYFVLWGWDITFPSNARKLDSIVGSNLGSLASTNLKDMDIERLPALVLIMRIRGSTDIFNVIEGNLGVNEFLSRLLEAIELFTTQQKVEVKEEEERSERERVKMEQDIAFHESLAADKAKDEAKRLKEEAEEAARLQRENEIATEMRRKEGQRLEAESRLHPEPPLEQGDRDAITKIRFRLPKGGHLERRFLVSASLQVLQDYLTVEGYPSEDYKIISSWPRRDLTAIDQTKTLEELKLYPQETVILEER
ncbi:FAS-associated factor 1 [Coccinella septempunctata]|uniref:FAS-associated factor 1 n=1 Tax=Coccinella septempunctata TaxID=41139 RepID=UPI001D0697C6|nr:FAS-associated factor 1 [Coccinella septempunctata]